MARQKKNELDTELDVLFENDAQLSEATIESETALEPESPEEPEEELVPIYIRSTGTDARKRKDEEGNDIYILEGSLNGKKFEIQCDAQLMVPPEIAGVLQELIKYQKGSR